jgi:MoaA/NifB/PqqE/SkfB family radical SAM enzyme
MNNLNPQYGFTGKLTSDFPSQINIDLTQCCNLECIHCPHNELKKTEWFKGLNLSTTLNKKLVDEVRSDGASCQYLRYTAAGEPLMHGGVFEILRYAVDNCEAKVNLTTNGVLLNRENVHNLLSTKLHSVNISVDAFSDDTYLKIHQKRYYDTVKQNVLYLLEKKQSAKIFVSFVEQEINKQETEEFKQFWYGNGADFVIVRRLHAMGGTKNDNKTASPLERDKIDRKPCLYPWERLTLGFDGRIPFFIYDSFRINDKSFDFSKTTVKDIWQGSEFQRLRSAHLNADFSGFPICAYCTDWQQTRWPWEGRSYADLMNET